ncbi:hypothetical protein M446_6021 [Methylobacterium sp. 4-46]|uniref:DUF1127 domain-containing protein n=1 Tax=unclassified Methylobacterium TaxID=2615210 RepID=UPI000152D94F|nr:MULTISPECIES: DUF1127 domain-containing protein [Methylobacterium]ACA20298.1 hypothetical protein M446_6021 [Methylobacterium sp. 4-46]WFT79472.1 DUF1127 domain-containing protein [Methylobacterium nodulans]
MTVGFAPLGVLSLVLRAGRVAHKGVATVIRLLAHRRAAHRLAALDDRMLRDLGLTRAEVVGALDLSWRDDPTLHLADRRHSKILGASPVGPSAVRVTLVARDGSRVGRGLAA